MSRGTIKPSLLVGSEELERLGEPGAKISNLLIINRNIQKNIFPVEDTITRSYGCKPVVGILDRLEKKGLVSRTRSQTDRRVVDLQLTGAGKEMVETAPAIAQVMLVKGLNELSAEQLAEVEAGMKHLVRILGAEDLTSQPLRG